MACAFDSAFDSPTGNGAFCVGGGGGGGGGDGIRVIRSPRYGITRRASVALIGLVTWLIR